ncbi:MAG TPA: hypoxanthine phosphoribosyltransferase [Firmicutes bacterium]|nr:hypoxanthine phosphoribosyltransferase [Bacillota bacterium]
MADDVKKILLSEEQIKAKVAELGAKITADYAGRSPVIICILKGAALFTSDLIRHIELPVAVDFMAISSYGMETKSSGVVRILKDLDSSVEGRHVLVVEDIIDSGLTLKYLEENLRSRRPASLAICALLDKATRRKIDIKLDYCGFVIPDEFVVGYGLDYAEKYRNLPFIGVLKPEIYGG